VLRMTAKTGQRRDCQRQEDGLGGETLAESP
jgi:hypothetical protein